MSVNPAHLHLILNHFPVVLTAVAMFLLGLAVLTRRQAVGRAGLWTLIAAAVIAIPVFLAGEGAEDVVEELGVIHALVEAHEESALLTLWTLIGLGVGSGVGLWFYRRDRLPRAAVVTAFVLSLGAGWLVVRTATLGGQIRHTEIRGELFAVPAEAREELEADAAQEAGGGHTDGPGTAHFDSLGTVHFPTSAPDDAERPFLRGVALLHSFEYDAAARAFRRAQERAPDYAMAYWGEAMTYNHPLWRQQDRDAALAALRRLAPTPEARRAKAATPREKAWLGTVEVLYGDGPKERRDTLYSRAMERLAERFPDDDEAEAFYALSLLGLEQGERHVPTFMRAGAIALDLFERHPRHPGTVHYAIHSFDDPAHAPLGLDAARAYADIAPAAAHAQHMTSHIFVALGMWKEAVAANEAAARTTARDRWGSPGGDGAGGAAGGAAGEGAAGERPDLYPCGHYAEWLSYAYLQQGRPTPARRLIEQCATLPDGDPGSVARMRAHYLVDTGAWDGPIARMTPDTARMPDRWLLARDFGDGLAAARRSELDAARSEIASLEARRSDLRSGLAADAGVLALILEAVVQFEAGETDAALATARRAVEAEAAQPVPYGPPSTYLPPEELLGRMLLSLDRPEEARGAFRRALERTPRRPASLLGLARATSEVGTRDVAAETYAELRRIWTDAEAGWPGLAETRSALDEYGNIPLARPD